MSTRRSPAISLVALLLIGNAGSGICTAYGRTPSVAFQYLCLLGVNWAIAWWVLIDCRERRIPTSIDHGFFVLCAWPVVLPYHLIATRGVRGCGLLAALAGVFLLTYLVALAAFYLLK